MELKSHVNPDCRRWRLNVSDVIRTEQTHLGMGCINIKLGTKEDEALN